MLTKINTKRLIAIFAVLLALVLVLQMSEKKKGNRSFKSELFTMDTASIKSIEIIGKTEPKVKLIKENDLYKLSANDKVYAADERQVNNMLATLVNLKAKRVAARGKDKWEEFQVTDSTATKVVVKTKKKDFELYVGKFTYQQPPQGQNPYMQQQRMQITTFVRLGGEDEVYAVDDFLTAAFSQETSSYRVKTIISSNDDEWTKISFNYPDSAFVLEKGMNNKWTVNGILADSNAVEQFTNSISNMSHSNFADVENLGSPAFTVSISGNNLNNINITAYKADSSTGYYVTSSQNPEAVFLGKQSGIIEKLFVGKENFLPAAEL